MTSPTLFALAMVNGVSFVHTNSTLNLSAAIVFAVLSGVAFRNLKCT